MAKVLIIDGYLDEPSCLGVPPYISPQIRYIYGAVKDSGVKTDDISYLTIDQLREKEIALSNKQDFDLLIILAGTTVPGKYLGGKPVTTDEIRGLTKDFTNEIILSGPITTNIEYDFAVSYYDNEIVGTKAYAFLTGVEIKKSDILTKLNHWAKLGAEVTKKHPNYPDLVCEIQTFRGCPRLNHCDFCSEGLKEITYQREVEAVIAEVKELAQQGNQYFRLGSQTDILLYQGENKKENILKPNPKAIRRLYSGIREVAPNLKVLHLDNINPATIADYPKLAKECLTEIVKYNTAGDVAAFGLESADPAVLKANNIGTTVEKTYQAVKILNQIGKVREDGVPKLLPGINLLHGLTGESKETIDLNYKFLAKILADDLMLRRINIRQVNPINNYQETQSYNNYQFKNYKDKVDQKINQPMLKQVFPKGTILKDVIIEKKKGKLSFGRQLGTYPILVGIPGRHKLGEKIDVKIFDYGYRSITGIKWPFKINQASIAELEALPGIGSKRAFKIFSAKKVTNYQQLQKLLPSYNLEQIKDLLSFE